MKAFPLTKAALKSLLRSHANSLFARDEGVSYNITTLMSYRKQTLNDKTSNMNTKFIRYDAITENMKSIMKDAKGMDIHSALFWAIYSLVAIPKFATCAEYGAYSEFTGAPKDDHAPETFGLCVFANKEDYFAFWKFCDER